MKALSILLSLVISLQIACTEKSGFKQSSNVEDPNIDLSQEERSAQTLLDSGIKFHFTMNVDGSTDDGGGFTAHGYESSDGIVINTGVAGYGKVLNAVRCFNDNLAQLDQILKNETLLDAGKREIGKRLVGINKEKQFLVSNLRGNRCSTYRSSSLRHLLAFEKWRDTP